MSLLVISPILLIKALFEHVSAPLWTWRVQRWRCMLTLCDVNMPPHPRPQPASSKRGSLPHSLHDSEAGPSTTALSPAAIHPEPQELDAIDKLRRGEGLFSWELLGLIEQCGICKLYFTGGVLRRHIFVCPSSEV
jgi:hypothetical protein